MKRIWTATAMLCFLILGALIWLRMLPEYDERELTEARQELDAVELELGQRSCHRPSIVDPVAHEETEETEEIEEIEEIEDANLTAVLLALFQGPDLHACREFIGQIDNHDGLFDSSVVAQQRFEDPDTGLNRLTQYPPPSADLRPDLERLDALCAPLRSQIARLAAASRTCSPIGHRVDQDVSLMPFVHLADVAALLARRQAGRGDFEGAILFLSQASATFADLARGPATLLSAMVSVGIRRRLVAHMASLLMSSPPLTEESYERIDNWFIALGAIEETPSSVFQGERIEAYRDGGPELEGLVLMSLTDVETWCPPDADPVQCSAGLRSIAYPPRPSPFEAGLRAVLGPRVGRSAREDRTRHDLYTGYFNYLGDLMLPHMLTQSLRVLLSIIREYHQGHGCPTELDAALAAVRFSDSRGIMLDRDGDDAYQLVTPFLMPPIGTGRQYILDFTCPFSSNLEENSPDAVEP